MTSSTRPAILIHQYGPHIFHTNSDEIFDYLSQFTEWRPYEHRVLAEVRGQLVPIPINRTTLNMLFDARPARPTRKPRHFSPRAPSRSTRSGPPRTSSIDAVGRELYELFFRGYTRKQWGLDPSELDKSVTARIPTRTNTDDRYFTDKLPGDAARRLHRDVRAHARPSRIDVRSAPTIATSRDEVDAGHIVFTGPIDEYFDFRFGKLPYRSLQFEHETLDQEQFQPVAVVNYPDPQTCPTRGSPNISI